MTRDEYQALTLIKSPKEALHQLRLLQLTMWAFLVLQVAFAFSYVATAVGGAPLFWRALAGLLLLLAIFLVTYQSITVVHLVRRPFYEVIVCLIFAPLSWFWYYGRWAKPLKIVIGKRPPPETAPTDLAPIGPFDLWMNSAWSRLLVAVLIFGLVFAYGYFKTAKNRSVHPMGHVTMVSAYRSDADKFTVMFPNPPTVKDASQPQSPDRRISYLGTADDGSTYGVVVETLDQTATASLAKEDSSSFFAYYLDRLVQVGMLSRLDSSSPMTYRNVTALQFNGVRAEHDVQGRMFIKDNHLYFIVAEMPHGTDAAAAADFFASFQLL